MPVVRAMLRESARSNYRFSSLILGRQQWAIERIKGPSARTTVGELASW
jgi:hypothetical protein